MAIYQGNVLVSGGGGGTSPYDAAKAGGYTGTEEEFNAILAMIPDEEKQNAWDGKADASDISDHAGDTNIHVTVDEKSAWNNKASEEELAVVQADAQSALEAAEAAQAAVDSEAAARASAISSEVSARAAAISALENKSRFTKLWEQTLSADSIGIDIPLSGIDWSQWYQVHLEIYARNGQAQIYCNDSSSGCGIGSILSSGNDYIRYPWLTFTPAFQPSRKVFTLWTGGVAGGTAAFPTFQELTQLSFTKGTIYANSTFTLWGEK